MFAFRKQPLFNQQCMRNLLFLIIFLTTLLNGPAAEAQLFGRRAPRGATPPKALLVTILTRKVQREYLKMHRPDLLPEFNRDVHEVAKRTILDYSRHFRYCPVYFFVDTMADKVATGEWEGVILDSAMQPVTNPVIRPGDKNFYIAYYGSPVPQPDSIRILNTSGVNVTPDLEADDPSALFREKLLVTDADFRMLSKNGPRTNYVRALRPPYLSANEYRQYRRELTYNAKRWFIDYMPTAYSYDATLRSYFKK
jgi:hypothetical protein